MVPVAAWASDAFAGGIGNFSTAPDKSKMRGSVYVRIVSFMSVCRISSIAPRGETPALLSSVP